METELQLRNMVTAFRVTELQTLLSYAGKNKNGRKNELQARALDLVKTKAIPTPNHIVLKVRELYRTIQQLEWLNCFKLHSVMWKSMSLLQYKVCLDHFEAKYKVWRGAGANMKAGLASTAIPTLNIGTGDAQAALVAQPRATVAASSKTWVPQRATRSSSRLSTLAQLPPASASVQNTGYRADQHQQQQQYGGSATGTTSNLGTIQSSRYHSSTPSAYNSSSDKMLQVLAQNQQPWTSTLNRGNPYPYVAPGLAKMPGLQALQSLGLGHGQPQLPICPDVRMKRLPFYDIITELHKPTSLICHGSRVLEASFPFCLTPSQAGDIASSKEYSVSAFGESKIQYTTQVQLRFCALETICDQDDLFPPSIMVRMNGKVVPLPHPIPSNRPGVEPKRPSRPLNVTNYVKLSPTVTNSLNVTWAQDPTGKQYTMSLYLVKKLCSKTLLNRLKSKGVRQADFTRGMIKDICQKDDSDCCVATTSLKVSLACPLGKCRMSLPCRANTCAHLQCFDANLFLQMNEKKPTWLCPVCDKPLLFESLAIDGYFDEIIKKLSLINDNSSNDVEILPDGTWTVVAPIKKEECGPPSKKLKPAAESKSGANVTINLDDELFIVEDDELMSVIQTGKPNEAPAPKPKPGPEDIIDLTISSSEDEAEPDPPTPRATGNANAKTNSGAVAGDREDGEIADQSDDEDNFRLRKRTKKPNYVVDDSSTSSSSSTSTKGPDSPACITLDSPSPSPEPREGSSRPCSNSNSAAAAAGASGPFGAYGGNQSRPESNSSYGSGHHSHSPFNLQAPSMPHLGNLGFGGVGLSAAAGATPLTRSQSNAMEQRNPMMVFPPSSSAPTYLPYDSRSPWDPTPSYSMPTDFTGLDYPSMDYFNQSSNPFSSSGQNNSSAGNGGSGYGGSGSGNSNRW